MTETPPPRRPLAAFLRGPAREEPAPAATDEVTQAAAAPATAASATPAPATTVAEPGAAIAEAAAPVAADAAAHDTADADSPSAPAPGVTQEQAVAPDAAALPATAMAAEPAAVDWRAAKLPVSAAAAPRFAQPRSRARARRAPAWQWALLAALALLLMLQILLADRARLAADARWRPLLSAVCGALRCDLPVWHEPSAFTMLDRDVRPSPGESAVLRIQASFRNDARWSQAWPWLQLSLSDADGRVIGSRVFSPAEYLGHAPEPGQTLAPGQSGRIDFRVREPAAGTAAFTFDFH